MIAYTIKTFHTIKSHLSDSESNNEIKIPPSNAVLSLKEKLNMLTKNGGDI